MTSRQLTIAGFILTGLAAVTLQAMAVLGRARVPSAGEAIDLLMRSRAGRVAVVLVWWWLGWHFLARTGLP